MLSFQIFFSQGKKTLCSFAFAFVRFMPCTGIELFANAFFFVLIENSGVSVFVCGMV